MKTSGQDAVRGLLRLFRRNGYLRRQNLRRYRAEGYQRYKKGNEIRLVANSKEELTVIRKWLTQAGFKLARPFAKDAQFRQPIYGKEYVRTFLEMLKQEESANQVPEDTARKLADPQH